MYIMLYLFYDCREMKHTKNITSCSNSVSDIKWQCGKWFLTIPLCTNVNINRIPKVYNKVAYIVILYNQRMCVCI